MAEEFYRKSGTRRLILAGTDKNVAHFKDLLSNRLRSMIIGQIAADANATPTDLRERALELAARKRTRGQCHRRSHDRHSLARRQRRIRTGRDVDSGAAGKGSAHRYA